MSNPIEKLRQKSLNYIVGYIFFLLLGLIGMSFQMFKYLNGTLILVSQEYPINPEIFLAAFFMMLILRPMVIVEIISKALKRKGNEL